MLLLLITLHRGSAAYCSIPNSTRHYIEATTRLPHCRKCLNAHYYILIRVRHNHRLLEVFIVRAALVYFHGHCSKIASLAQYGHRIISAHRYTTVMNRVSSSVRQQCALAMCIGNVFAYDVVMEYNFYFLIHHCCLHFTALVIHGGVAFWQRSGIPPPQIHVRVDSIFQPHIFISSFISLQPQQISTTQ